MSLTSINWVGSKTWQRTLGFLLVPVSQVFMKILDCGTRPPSSLLLGEGAFSPAYLSDCGEGKNSESSGSWSDGEKMMVFAAEEETMSVNTNCYNR